jgi:hypothetical protein
MKSILLLPASYKRIGWLLLIPSLLLGIGVRFFDFEWKFLTVGKGREAILDSKINFTDEIALTGIILGLLFIAFAREKQEDEFIYHTRLQSWQWSVLINYGLLLLATWLVHGLAYIDVMMYNMLTVLIIFIIRFHWVMNREKKSEQ